MYELVQTYCRQPMTTMRRTEYPALRGLVATIALSAVGCGATAAETPVDAAVAAAPVLDDRYPSAKVMFGSDVESYPDLIYSTPAGFRPLRLDLYRSTAAAPRPLVVYVHGGGWQSGHTRHSGAFENWPQVLASLARRGYVVASLEYRLSGEAKFPAAIHDVKIAIRWLRASASKFAIDPSQVVIWGGSAGGQLAALAATSCGVQALAPVVPPSSPLDSQSDCVQGLVAWYGVFDLGAIPELSSSSAGRGDPSTSPVAKYLGCAPAKCAESAALASAVTHLDAKDPPALLIHGALDEVVPVSQSRVFNQALKQKGIAAELLVIPDVDHSFIGESPGATREASLLALTETFEFIDSLRGGKSR
jgi:acetyl esterase/lipase